MRKSIVLVALAAVAVVCLIPAVASADVIYDTFAPTDPFSSAAGPAIFGSRVTAYQFGIFGGDYYLQSLEIGAQLVTQGSNTMKVYLYEANTQGQVGSLLESITVNNAFMGGSWQSVMANSTANPLLRGGTYYWIGVGTVDTSTDFTWCLSSVPGLATVIGQNSGTGWIYGTGIPANFRVYGTTDMPSEVVPEPSALILALLGGSGAMGGIMLRRKR